MSVASAEGSRWETAVAILMLRHCIEAVNAELSRDKNSEHSEDLETSGFSRKQSRGVDAKKHVGLGKGGKWNDRTQLKRGRFAHAAE